MRPELAPGAYYYIRYCFPGEDEPLYTKVARPAAQYGADAIGDNAGVGTLSFSARARHVISLPGLVVEPPPHAASVGACDGQTLLGRDLIFELWSATDDKKSVAGTCSNQEGRRPCPPMNGQSADSDEEHTFVASSRASISVVMKHRQQHLWLALINAGIPCGELLIQAVYSCDVPVFTAMQPLHEGEGPPRESDVVQTRRDVPPPSFADLQTPREQSGDGPGESVKAVTIQDRSDAAINAERDTTEESGDSTGMQVSEAVKILETLDSIGGIDLGNGRADPLNAKEDFGGVSVADADIAVAELGTGHGMGDVSECEKQRIVDAADDFSRTTATIRDITKELEDLVCQIKGRGSGAAQSRMAAKELIDTGDHAGQTSTGSITAIENVQQGGTGASVSAADEIIGDNLSTQQHGGEDLCTARVDSSPVSEKETKKFHAAVSHTPSPATKRSEPQSTDAAEEETSEDALKGVESLQSGADSASPSRNVSSTLAEPAFRMSDFRRRLLEKEMERIQKIMGTKVARDLSQHSSILTASR